MAAEFILSTEARLHEALARESYYQQRCEALAQHLINRDKDIADLRASRETLEVELKARIAGLEDALRIARNTPNNEDTNAE